MARGSHVTAHASDDEDDTTNDLRHHSLEVVLEAQDQGDTGTAPVIDSNPLSPTSPQSHDTFSSRHHGIHSHHHGIHSPPHNVTSPHSHRAASPSSRKRSASVASKSSFMSLRKQGRVGTSNVAYITSDMGRSTGWMPGSEPGVDTSDPEPPQPPPYSRTYAPAGDLFNPKRLSQPCEITCVDYSEDNLEMAFLDNDNLTDHLAKPRPAWSQVRWFNINGLSWDVIRAIGQHKDLHRLAIEDLMNTRSRTKADWYSDHAFVVLPLQKLVNFDHRDDDVHRVESGDRTKDTEAAVESADLDSVPTTQYLHERERRLHEERQKRRRKGAINMLLHDLFTGKKHHHPAPGKLTVANSFKKSSKVNGPWVPKRIRTLQRWHSGPNMDRIAFMERNSALSMKGFAVSMEQVSIFLCADNTVISFFEYSAQDVEMPLVRRLQSSGTILRQSADASMLLQSIIDTVVDLAIDVTTAYQDTLGDLELEVLTDPRIHESKMIYILISELAQLRNAIAPVVQLMGALREHKADVKNTSILATRAASPKAVLDDHSKQLAAPHGPSRPPAKTAKSFSPGSTVRISPLAVMYLGDAEDHAVLIQDAYDQMRRNADNLVDLIFNTVSAYQNESMKQLTLVTCFFLPLSFMTGYFGMNFTSFSAIEQSDSYFWKIAAPVCVVVALLLLREKIERYTIKWANKTLIRRNRQRRLAHSAR